MTMTGSRHHHHHSLRHPNDLQSTGNDDHEQMIGHDLSSRIRQLETVEPLRQISLQSSTASAPFKSTHACLREEDTKLGKQRAQAVEGLKKETSIQKPPCEIHFPILMDNTTVKMTSSPHCPDRNFCLHSFLACDDVPASSDAVKALCIPRLQNGTSTTTPNDHAALIRPLRFDTSGRRRVPSDNATSSSHCQLLVLAHGISGKDGGKVAELVVRHMPLFILEAYYRYAKSETKIPKIISHSFELMDRSLYEQEKTLWKRAGSTAVIILQHKSKLFMAWAGTSTAILAQWNKDTGQAEIVYRAHPHSPDDPDERRRIEKLGGRVAENSENDSPASNSFRIFLPGDTLDPGIATSRSMGAGKWKFKGVTAMPTIHEVDLTEYLANENTLFVVAASNALTQHISEEELVNELGQTLYGEISFAHDSVLESKMQSLISQAAEAHDRAKVVDTGENGKVADKPPNDMTLAVSTILSA